MKKLASDPARTLLTICIGFLVLYFFTRHEWILYFILPFGLAGILSSWFRKFIDNLWMKLVWVLGHIVPPIILTLIFFVVVFPVSFLARLTKRQGIIQLKDNEKSLLIAGSKEFPKSSFERPW
jgi:hypothetical protein